MESIETRRSYIGQQETTNLNWGGEDSHRILVAVDVDKGLSFTAMDWTLDHICQRGDNLRLLGIIQQNNNPGKGGFQAGLSKLGYKSWVDEKSWNGSNRSILDSETASKKQQLQNNLDLHLRCQKLGVSLDIDVQISRDVKVLVVEEAKSFGAHHVVLDRSMKKDKKYFIDHLTCYVTRVKTIDVCEPLRPGLPPDMMLDPPPASPKLEPESAAAVGIASHRRSTASSFVSCMADSDFQSLQDEAEVIEVDRSEHGSTTYSELEIMDKSAVRQWLEDQGSPELGSYPGEESLQLSISPSSDIVGPSTEASFAEHMSTLPKISTNSTMNPREERREIVANPSASLVSDGSPTAVSSLTESESLVSRPVASTMTVAASKYMNPITPTSFPGALGVGRPDAWSPMDICAPGNGNGARQGPISVQPRRADSSWQLHNLNDLLNGDARIHHPTPEMVSVKSLESVEQIVKVPPPLALKYALSPKDICPSPLSVQRPTEFRSSSIRRAVFMKKQGPLAPPLCTVCKHKTPEFGKAVRRFSYAELQAATDNFSHRNYLAQGGYGSVYRGILPEGQLIAVKQHRIASSQSDEDFSAEVEVLSCAQHRNLVTLIGYCVEDHKRLLVYEYVCHGSLDRHLSARNKEGLQWKYRQKIAIGAARALRYLHEECRVGCIVHRDMRPNNILLTHDFNPMVGDFGLARRQMNGEMAEETRVLGTLGYLAPEYAETGQITEKADVYAFGVVLLEIITGRKAVIDQQSARGGILLTDWARPLLDNSDLELVDPRLKPSGYDLFEMHCMMHAARQCIKKDPSMRPRMTQVLRILDPAQDCDTPYAPGMGARKLKSDAIVPSYTPPQEIEITPDYGSSMNSPYLISDSQIESYGRIPKLSSRNSRLKKPSKTMFKTSRSSSAPRLSYDEERNLEDDDDGFKKDGVLLSYNSMLEFV